MLLLLFLKIYFFFQQNYLIFEDCPFLFYYCYYQFFMYFLDLFVAPELRVLAMENWGLITAAENSVGYNRQLCDARTKLWVADVIAHEIAHMVIYILTANFLDNLKHTHTHTQKFLIKTVIFSYKINQYTVKAYTFFFVTIKLHLFLLLSFFFFSPSLQWFGNLATMRWWNDMWINEGFATMMAVKAADFVQNTTIRTVQFFCDVVIHYHCGYKLSHTD